MDDYMNLSREEVHAFLKQSLADLEELRREKTRGAVTVGPIDRSIACLRYLQEVMGMLYLFMDAPLCASVPVSELEKLRDDLYENDQITMKGLMKLNRLVSKYDSQREAGHGR